jgi:hypothetical protein
MKAPWPCCTFDSSDFLGIRACRQSELGPKWTCAFDPIHEVAIGVLLGKLNVGSQTFAKGHSAETLLSQNFSTYNTN